MKRIIISWAIALGALALFAPASQAAQLVIDIPSCTSYAFNSSTGTVTCVTGGSAKSCSVSGASSGVTGSQVTLTGSCTGFTPTSTDWTGCAQEDGTTCVMSATGTATFKGTDDTGTPYSGSKLVTFSAPSCSITGTATGTVGAALLLDDSCNFTPTTFLWTGCDTAATASSCTINKTVAGTYTVSLTASDADGHTASATKSVTFSSASGGMPSTCVLNTYPTGTIAVPKTLKTSAANGGRPITTLDTGTYDVESVQDSVVMAQIKVPASGSGMSYAEYGSIATTRAAYASKTPCDMSPSTLVKTATSGTIKFSIGSTSGVSGSTVKMIPGETWYIMIINYRVNVSPTSGVYLAPTVTSCNSGSTCAMRLGTY